MEHSDSLDQLLKKALSPTVEPSEIVNQKILNQLKENSAMKKGFKKRTAVPLIAAALMLILSVTAFAAWKLLSPKQVAEKFGNQTLANAFEDKSAVEINKSTVSGGYRFTLLGIVSGKNLSAFKDSSQEIRPDRTYAVVSIAKEDGVKMPAVRDKDYDQTHFIMSPLIKGQIPWRVNIFTMNGGYSECVVDGIMYRMIECDSIEMFADRGLYLGISTGDSIDNKTFLFDKKSGEISLNTAKKGASALFDLPLDVKKADHDKAEEYLQKLLNPPKESSADSRAADRKPIDWNEECEKGTVMPDSIKEVTYDENGLAYYEYDGQKVGATVNHLFDEGQAGVWKVVGMGGSDKELTAVQYSKDKNGKIIGRAVKLSSDSVALFHSLNKK
jgi:hypothetical protein